MLADSEVQPPREEKPLRVLPPSKKPKKKWFSRGLIYTGLIILTIVCFIPFLMMLVNATRTNGEIMSGFSLIPGSALVDGYFSAMTAFGFAFYNFKGKNVMFIFMLVMMMVPGQLGLIGFYEISKTLGILDSFIPLIIPSIASPFVVFFIRQYTQATLHVSMIEAARIDGASELRIFHTIALPMMMPAVATMSIFTFIGSWNNYLMPLVLLFSPEKYTLPVLMGFLKGSQVAENLGALYLGIAISVVPIMIAFLFLSKYIVSSISAGAVKE